MLGLCFLRTQYLTSFSWLTSLDGGEKQFWYVISRFCGCFQLVLSYWRLVFVSVFLYFRFQHNKYKDMASPVSPIIYIYVLQLTFRHMLPNFNECWWDSIVLDILICNWFGIILKPPCHSICFASKMSWITVFIVLMLVGIWAGMYTVRYFDGKTYEWVGISRQPNIIGKVGFVQPWECIHMVVAIELVMRIVYFFSGEKDTWAVHTSSLGQRRVASAAGTLAFYSSTHSLHRFLDSGAEHILSQV